jgi:2-desacetyl-2-hydroxyethyl bacteriochlorophyllide A dehydrogenase
MPDAVWFGGPQQVEIREEPAAPVGPDDVRVRALVSGLSAGSELLVYRGSAPRTLAPDLPTVRGDFGFPIKFAYASVGRVVEVGSRVGHLAVDDLVFVHHPHQTEYVVPADMPIRLPQDLPADVGVFAANLETAVTVVLDAHPRLGEAVLVTGQGVVGLLVTMLLRRAGAAPIVTADLHELRRAASAADGARSHERPRRGCRDRGQREPGRPPGLHRRNGVRRDRRGRLVVRRSRRQPESR